MEAAAARCWSRRPKRRTKTAPSSSGFSGNVMAGLQWLRTLCASFPQRRGHHGVDDDLRHIVIRARLVAMDTTQRYASFAEFYPFYLGEHAHPVCRRLHVVGSTLVLAIIVAVIARIVSPWALLALPLVGYGFAWIGHFYFEKNKPATFKYPLYSFAGDWVMYRDILIGRIPFFPHSPATEQPIPPTPVPFHHPQRQQQLRHRVPPKRHYLPKHQRHSSPVRPLLPKTPPMRCD